MKKGVVLFFCATLLSSSLMARGHGGGHYGSYGSYNAYGHHSGEHHGNYGNHRGYGGYGNHGSQIQTDKNATVAEVELSQEQESALIFMYQEEKLARDVYTNLAEKWNLKIFNNIKNAEQKHMDAVKNLLQAYGVPVPVIEDEVGVFEDTELQDLYNQLMERGSQSQEDALNVGVTIEEADIADLEARMEGATEGTQKVFSYLLRASQNHLKAFNRVLDSLVTP